MSKNSLTLLFGVLVLLIPYLGIPRSWKTVAFSLLGLAIIATSLLLKREIVSGSMCAHLREEKHTDSYSQNGPVQAHKKRYEEERHTEQNKDEAAS